LDKSVIGKLRVGSDLVDLQRLFEAAGVVFADGGAGVKLSAKLGP
jgi:hypothetical protein